MQHWILPVSQSLEVMVVVGVALPGAAMTLAAMARTRVDARTNMMSG